MCGNLWAKVYVLVQVQRDLLDEAHRIKHKGVLCAVMSHAMRTAVSCLAIGDLLVRPHSAHTTHTHFTQAKRTKAAVPILQAARRAILLTGTPTLSRPGELLPQLQVRLVAGFHAFRTTVSQPLGAPGSLHCSADPCTLFSCKWLPVFLSSGTAARRARE